MAEKVNLDALIPREDLEITETTQRGKRKDTVSISDVVPDGFFLLNIYKPDFQRETTEWDYVKICRFVESFLNNELIPALILWQSSGGSVFVIDGAHRLSSLIAWVNDDYGDGVISRKFFNGNIPEEQLIVAERARKYIEKTVGPYKNYKDALYNPDVFDVDIVKKARVLSSAAIQLQWVEGDVSSAEKSFFNINQQGAAINPTELDLIKSRRKANCISARAIMRMGMGHKYWSGFSNERQEEIERLSKELYEIMFLPKLETPVKTLDVPMCGKHNNSSLPIIYEFINICNINSKFDVDDKTGEETIKCLKQTRKVARMINSNHVSSLGLHPLVYFYAQNGSFRVSAFYAVALFVIELDNKKKKDIFIKNRKEFEKIFYKNSSLVQVISRKYRSSKNGMPKTKEFFMEILNKLEDGVDSANVIDIIRKMKDYQYLPDIDIVNLEGDSVDFNTSKKSEVYIRQVISTAPCCKICGGYLHKNAISIDHIERKQDGGKATTDNGQITHPYCNTGYKN